MPHSQSQRWRNHCTTTSPPCQDSDYDGVPRLKLAYYHSVELFGKSHSLESVVGIEGETFMLGKDLLGDHSLLLLLPAG
jgi:hypothetical protein